MLGPSTSYERKTKLVIRKANIKAKAMIPAKDKSSCQREGWRSLLASGSPLRLNGDVTIYHYNMSGLGLVILLRSIKEILRVKKYL